MCEEGEKKLARAVVSNLQLFVAPAFQLQSTNQGWPVKKPSLQVQVVKKKKVVVGKKSGQEGPGSCFCFIIKVQGRG